MHWILSLEFDHFAIPRPGLNIFLDVPFAFAENNLTAARTGNDRHYLNGNRDIHEESMTFQKHVRDIYLNVARSDNRLAVIDCSNRNGEMLKPQEIFNLIVKILIDRKLI
jgi:dTMP kinase